MEKESCPKTLSNLVYDDPKDSLWGMLKSHEKTCSSGLQSQTGALPHRLLEIYKSKDPQLQDPLIMKRLNSCARQYPAEQAKKMISKYFVNQKRLEQASLLRLSELAGIDSILQNQKPSLKETCSQSSFGSVLKKCESFLEKCSSKENIQTLSEQTSQILREMDSLKKEIQLVEKENIPSASPVDSIPREKKLQFLKAELKNKENIIPWIGGEKFKQIYSSTGSISDAILAQLKENRTELIKDFQSLQKASQCYRGSEGPECSPQSLRKTLATTPSLPSRFKKDMQDFPSSDAWLAYHEHESYQECITDMKFSQDDTSEVVSDAVISTAASLALGGIGTLYTSARVAILLKDLAQLTVATTQAHWLVSESTAVYNSCIQQTFSLERKNSLNNSELQCPHPSQNISQAMAVNTCYQHAALAAISGLSLGMVKASISKNAIFQANTVSSQISLSPSSPPNWQPKNPHELGNYFALHNREVNKNAGILLNKYKSFFPDISTKDLKLLEKHDLEKFMSFKVLSEKYDYKGIPKEIIEGLRDKEKYLQLLSKDGKNVEMSINDGLFILWGNSKEGLPEKIRMARTAEEKLHLESLLKLRIYIVDTMKTVDDKIMASVFSQVPTAKGRVQLKMIDMISDLSARNSNPLTQIEFGRPTLSTSDYIFNQMKPDWVIDKIADSTSSLEKSAAQRLFEKIGGASGVKDMSQMLEQNYQSSGTPNQLVNFLRKGRLATD